MRGQRSAGPRPATRPGHEGQAGSAARRSASPAGRLHPAPARWQRRSARPTVRGRSAGCPWRRGRPAVRPGPEPPQKERAAGNPERFPPPLRSMHTHLTIVGGGLAGLVAAIAAREAGLDVTLYEARRQLGGRARTAPGAYRANWGPHVIYADGPLWAWLDRRGLARPVHRFPARARVAFRAAGQARLLPPAAVSKGILRLRNAEAPVDRSFAEWATERLKDQATAARIAAFMGVTTFDYDPGRLSAAFVTRQLHRATSFPPMVRYVPGGWANLTARLASHARELGARVETGSPVSCLPPAPVILAVPLAQAAKLLGDPSLTWTGTRTALLDIGVTRRRQDPFILSDLDQPGFAENYGIPDRDVAPAGETLIQSQAGIRPDEDL